MKMAKKIVCFFCAAAIFFSMLCVQVGAKEDNSSARNRKLVSIVYDDSGSMCNERWEYTNYAIQCFAAMLNTEDKLDITYMSSYEKGSFSVDTNNRAASVKKIREHSQSGGTPVESIDTAFKTLKDNNDKNVNTQYWLIVITDGQMSGDETAEEKINRMADTKMPNGTKPQIIYMTICDEGNMFTPSFAKPNVKCERALTADAVIETISNVACDISGRYAVAENDMTFVDDTTVKVRSDVPLLHLGVLSQRTDALVKQVTGSEGQMLNEESNVHVELPGKYTDTMSEESKGALRGNVSLFNSKTNNIPADTYTITFTEKVSKKDLVIMFEPAFELRIEVFDDNTKIDDLSKLVVGQTVDFKASLYEIGTDNKILPSMLPSGMTEQMVFSENGSIVLNEKDLSLENIVLKDAQTEVTATVEIPGFFTVRDILSFTPSSIKFSDMTATVYYDGSKRQINKDGSTDPNNVVYVTGLKSNETGVKFTIYVDGAQIDKAQALSLKDQFTKGLNLDFNNYKVTVCDDGGIIVAPTSTMVPSLIYWLFHRGDSVIEVTCGGKTASDTICFKLGDVWAAVIPIIGLLIALALLIYIAYWIFGKPHFKRSKRITVYVARTMGGEYNQNFGATKSVNWLSASGPLNFLGPKGMKKKVDKFVIRATKGGYELLGVKGRYVSSSINYPCAATGLSESKIKAHRFASSVYIYDNDTYYKITVSVN